MTDRLYVDVHHIRRSGAVIVDYGHELRNLAHQLQTETAAGPRWTGEHGGETFTEVFSETTRLALDRLEQIARDLEDIGANLRSTAGEFEASDERTGTDIRRLWRDR